MTRYIDSSKLADENGMADNIAWEEYQEMLRGCAAAGGVLDAQPMPPETQKLIYWTDAAGYPRFTPVGEYAAAQYMNNYKPDSTKPPVKSAVLVPFRLALLALARMMQNQVRRHKLEGAKDPFQEWAQLPDAEKRLAEAQGRHTLFRPDEINEDSGETHALHDLWNSLAVVELQERRKESNGPVET